jgi:hypothetical protein
MRPRGEKSDVEEGKHGFSGTTHVNSGTYSFVDFSTQLTLTLHLLAGPPSYQVLDTKYASILVSARVDGAAVHGERRELICSQQLRAATAIDWRGYGPNLESPDSAALNQLQLKTAHCV